MRTNDRLPLVRDPSIEGGAFSLTLPPFPDQATAGLFVDAVAEVALHRLEALSAKRPAVPHEVVAVVGGKRFEAKAPVRRTAVQVSVRA